MNTIFIDTSNNRKIIIKLEKDGKFFDKTVELENPRSDIALELIEQILKEAKISVHDVNKISVKRGPGSFTGLRVGISIANALSFALGIPVNKKEPGEIEEAEY